MKQDADNNFVKNYTWLTNYDEYRSIRVTFDVENKLTLFGDTRDIPDYIIKEFAEDLTALCGFDL